jgi:hypothetical protein
MLLETTNTQLNAMAAPGIIRLSRPAAARGGAAMLTAKAQNRLPLMTARVRRDSRIASAATAGDVSIAGLHSTPVRRTPSG